MDRLVTSAVAAVLLCSLGACGGAESTDSPRDGRDPEGLSPADEHDADPDGSATEGKPATPLVQEMEHLELTPREALGQSLIGRYTGRTPPEALLSRIRAGELGGVILFRDNVEMSSSEIRQVTRLLQREAVGGGNPPLLILTDQEGGEIKRLPGPPRSSPAQIQGAAEAEVQGALTGAYLRGLGINVNLAPVVDVPSGATFIRERTFGTDPDTVAERACAFAEGLLAEGVAATLKHFPGLGWAETNTDAEPTTVSVSPDALRADYLPYRRCGRDPRTLTMVSSASYPRLTGDLPAVMSAGTYDIELPKARATGPTISDDLEAPALATTSRPAGTALAAGLSLALYAKTEAGSAGAYSALRGQLQEGLLDVDDLRRNLFPVLALKAVLEPDLAARYLRGRSNG